MPPLARDQAAAQSGRPNVDSFLSSAPDAEIAKLATFFTNPTVVAVLRQLVSGKKSVADLANGCVFPKVRWRKPWKC